MRLPGARIKEAICNILYGEYVFSLASQVCLGDVIEVLVYNKLGSDELTFHWHGIRQKGSNHMDGVPMITQCPILPFSGFRYKINPESVGTYLYYAHSGT